MSTERLREAARVLREDSEAASRSEAEGPWTWRVTGDKKWAVVMDADGSWMAQVDDDDRAAYIATMHPGVGLALAKALDTAADAMGHGDLCMDCFHPTCLTVGELMPVADKILGDAS